MSLKTALVSLKTANGTLNTLVGTRFHPDVRPQGGDLPCVVFQDVSRIRDYTFGVGLPRLSHPVILMKAYASSAADLDTLCAALRGCFSSTTSQTVGSASVDGLTIENELSGGVELLDTNAKAWCQIFHVRVHIRE